MAEEPQTPEKNKPDYYFAQVRGERKKNLDKKIRVLVRFSEIFLFESFAKDISKSGAFVVVKSKKELRKMAQGKEVTVYLEFDLENMFECRGIITRVHENPSQLEYQGFGLAFANLSNENQLYLQQMLANL